MNMRLKTAAVAGMVITAYLVAMELFPTTPRDASIDILYSTTPNTAATARNIYT